MKNIGFIGTGIMGKPMALNLQKAGYELLLSEHYKTVPPELLEQNAKVYQTPREVTEAADFIITMLPDTPNVESVIFGNDGI